MVTSFIFADTFPFVMTADLQALPWINLHALPPDYHSLICFEHVLSSQAHRTAHEDPVEWTETTGWSMLQSCAQDCFAGGYPHDIWGYGDCHDNACVCEADRQPVVAQSLSSCVSASCTSNTADLSCPVNDRVCTISQFSQWSINNRHFNLYVKLFE